MPNVRTRQISMVAIGLAMFPGFAVAHHSVGGFFDPSTTVEIEGVVRTVKWRNPHTIFEIDVTGPSGEITTWRIESGALGILRSRGIGREFVKIGDHVKIMGDSSLRSDHEMFARNMLLSDGKEVMLTPGSKPYFSVEEEGGILEAVFDEELTALARENADGVFRVWSTNIDESRTSGGRMFNRKLPLLSDAEARRSEYDSGDASLLGCTEWSMPRLMSNPLPMEFVRRDDDILQRFEEDDNVRVIHMDPDAADGSDEYLVLGYSVGRWDGETLVVETTRVEPDRLDNRGTPFSSAMHLLERFTPSPDGTRLNYSLTITDPHTFSESFEVGRYWIWRPEMAVGAYDCEQDQDLG